MDTQRAVLGYIGNVILDRGEETPQIRVLTPAGSHKADTVLCERADLVKDYRVQLLGPVLQQRAVQVAGD